MNITSADVCYLTPALTGSGSTNCAIDATTFTESFERSSFGCWTATDKHRSGVIGRSEQHRMRITRLLLLLTSPILKVNIVLPIVIMQI